MRPQLGISLPINGIIGLMREHLISPMLSRDPRQVSTLYKRTETGYVEADRVPACGDWFHVNYANGFVIRWIAKVNKLYALNLKTSKMVRIGEDGWEYSDSLYPYVWVHRTQEVLEEMRYNVETGEKVSVVVPYQEGPSRERRLSKDTLLVERNVQSEIWVSNEKEARLLHNTVSSVEDATALDSGGYLIDPEFGKLVHYGPDGKRLKEYEFYHTEEIMYSEFYGEGVEDKLVLPRSRVLINSPRGVLLIDLDTDRVIETLPRTLLIGSHYAEDINKGEDMRIRCAYRALFSGLLVSDLIGVLARYAM